MRTDWLYKFSALKFVSQNCQNSCKSNVQIPSFKNLHAKFYRQFAGERARITRINLRGWKFYYPKMMSVQSTLISILPLNFDNLKNILSQDISKTPPFRVLVSHSSRLALRSNISANTCHWNLLQFFIIFYPFLHVTDKQRRIFAWACPNFKP